MATDVRKRISHRINRNRLKLEVKRSVRSATVLAIAMICALLGAAWVVTKVAPNLIDSSHSVSFAVDDSTGVIPGLDPVRYKGIPAGRISSVKLNNGRAVITVSLENSFGTIYKNARATLRPNSALEDMYLDITSRGTPSAGQAQPSVPIAASQTATAVNIDDVLGTFNTNTRAQLRTLLDNLGNGLSDHGAQLQEAFVEAVPLLQVAGRLSQQLALRKPLTQQLVHNASVLTADLGQRNTQLRDLVDYASQTLGTLQNSGANLKATLADLPGTLNDVNSSFTATMHTLGRVNTAVTSLNPVADTLSNSLTAVRNLSDAAKPAVNALATPIKRLVPLSDSLPSLSSSLSSSVSKLHPQAPVLVRAVQDLAQCKAGIEGFFQWDASMTKFGDSRGLVPRGNVAVGLQSGGVSSPFEAALPQCIKGGPIGGTNPSLGNNAH